MMSDPEHGHFDADEVVVAAGAHSASLASSVGDWCPLDTERGHHVMFPSGSEGLLSRAVCDPTQGFVMTPMAGGMRAAGTVELGGTGSPLTRARCQQLERASMDLLNPEAAGGLSGRLQNMDWVGFRPSMPDALPVLGPLYHESKGRCQSHSAPLFWEIIRFLGIVDSFLHLCGT